MTGHGADGGAGPTALTDREVRPRAGDGGRRGHRRARTVAVVSAVLILVLAVVAAILVWGTSVFAVRHVTVRGARTVSATQVVQLADIRPGTRLTAVDDSAVRARIRAAFPAVASVRIGRNWPSGIELRLTERTPVAVVGKAGDYRLIDGGGNVYGHVSTRPRGLTLVTLDRPGPSDARTRAALQVIQAMPAALRAKVASVAAPRPDAITLTLTDKRTVAWGGAEQSATKGAALLPLLSRPAKHFDLSAGDTVVLR